MNAVEELRMMFDRDIITSYCSDEEILAALNACYNQGEGATKKFLANLGQQEGREKEDEEIEAYDLLDTRQEQAPIIRLLNLILSEAINQRASDIHFEPYE